MRCKYLAHVSADTQFDGLIDGVFLPKTKSLTQRQGAGTVMDVRLEHEPILNHLPPDALL